MLEIDSDKASMEVPSPCSGVVREILAAEGDEVEVLSVVARIEEGAVAEVAASSDPEPAVEEGARAVSRELLRLGVRVDELQRRRTFARGRADAR